MNAREFAELADFAGGVAEDAFAAEDRVVARGGFDCYAFIFHSAAGVFVTVEFSIQFIRRLEVTLSAERLGGLIHLSPKANLITPRLISKVAFVDRSAGLAKSIFRSKSASLSFGSSRLIQKRISAGPVATNVADS